MKAALHLTLIAAGLFAVPIRAQNPTDNSLIEPVETGTVEIAPVEATAPAAVEPTAPAAVEPTAPAAVEPAAPAAVEPTAPAAIEPAAPAIEPTTPATAPVGTTPAAPGGSEPGAIQVPDTAAQEPAQKAGEGFIIKDASLNDIFQFLSKSAGRQYFHNSKIAGPEFTVTGHLNDGDPLQQMEELAFMYGLSLHVKGNTIYALTQAQLGQLPSSEFHYQLRYLRPTDVETIKDLIRPVLSPGTGIVNFEPKTNTIIIIDSAHRIEAAQKLLHGIDKAKGQIIVETKILRINSSAAERTGINWANSLGADGTDIGLARNLNSVFGIDDTSELFADANLVLTPLQISGVLRALSEGNLASQVSNPTLITEDNERATISIIDRIPILTTQTTQASTGVGAQPTVTEEVRYKIDQGDKSIDTDPEAHREIGISIVVTPTLLPDGTIRMKMRPRSAQITGSITGTSGNEYPQVTESMIETLARIPDGHSLVVGGFYGEVESDNKNKVPVLGDIPVLNFFFKSKDASKEKNSLVFVVTPTSYNPQSGVASSNMSNRIKRSTAIGKDHNWIDPYNPGPAHEPNLPRAVRGLQPTQAPYYPRAKVVIPAGGH